MQANPAPRAKAVRGMTPAMSTELLPVQGRSGSGWNFAAARGRAKFRSGSILAQGGVVITLPPRASRRAGLSLLQTHEAWVAEKLAELPGAIPFMAGAVIPG